MATIQHRWLLSRGIGSTAFPFSADTLSMSAQGVSVYWKPGVDKGRDCGGTISRGGRQKEKIYKKACGGNYHTPLVAGVKARMHPSPGFLTYCYWSLVQFQWLLYSCVEYFSFGSCDYLQDSSFRASACVRCSTRSCCGSARDIEEVWGSQSREQKPIPLRVSGPW